LRLQLASFFDEDSRSHFLFRAAHVQWLFVENVAADSKRRAVIVVFCQRYDLSDLQ
jgi:hypothetical protein